MRIKSELTPGWERLETLQRTKHVSDKWRTCQLDRLVVIARRVKSCAGCSGSRWIRNAQNVRRRNRHAANKCALKCKRNERRPRPRAISSDCKETPSVSNNNCRETRLGNNK